MKRGRHGEHAREPQRVPPTAAELRAEEEARITQLVVRLGEKSLEGIHEHLDTLARVRAAPPRAAAHTALALALRSFLLVSAARCASRACPASPYARLFRARAAAPEPAARRGR